MWRRKDRGATEPPAERYFGVPDMSQRKDPLWIDCTMIDLSGSRRVRTYALINSDHIAYLARDEYADPAAGWQAVMRDGTRFGISTADAERIRAL